MYALGWWTTSHFSLLAEVFFLWLLIVLFGWLPLQASSKAQLFYFLLCLGVRSQISINPSDSFVVFPSAFLFHYAKTSLNLSQYLPVEVIATLNSSRFATEIFDVFSTISELNNEITNVWQNSAKTIVFPLVWPECGKLSTPGFCFFAPPFPFWCALPGVEGINLGSYSNFWEHYFSYQICIMNYAVHCSK